jgi:peptide/nickel transport system permease protein
MSADLAIGALAARASGLAALGRTVARAIAKFAATLLALSLVTFLATNAIPGNPAISALGKSVSAVELRDFRIQEGLNRPVLERYVYWIGNFLRGNWGVSLDSQMPVRSEVLPALMHTVTLALAAFAIAVPVAMGLGVFSGRRAGRPADRLISGVTLLFSALPEFVIGIVLLIVVAVWLRLLPVDSSALAFGGLGPWQTLRNYALPAITLALTVIPYVLRLTRANTVEVVREPFVQAARLRGIRGLRLSVRHIAPNAARPVINVLAINLAELMSGVVVVETVYGFPGVGQLLVSAVEAQDIATVQAITLAIGTFFVALNLVADVCVAVLNPRLRT